MSEKKEGEETMSNPSESSEQKDLVSAVKTMANNVKELSEQINSLEKRLSTFSEKNRTKEIKGTKLLEKLHIPISVLFICIASTIMVCCDNSAINYLFVKFV